MVAKLRVPLDPVADLRRRLARRPGRRRAVVRRWWRDHGLAAHPAVVGKRVALALIEQRAAEPKLAGVLVLHELLGEALRASDLPAFARLFEAGHLAERLVVDAFATRVLGILLARGRGELAPAVAAWRDAAGAWQRRAACVGLAIAAARGAPAVVGPAFATCATVVWSPERVDHLAVGSLLRALSRAAPARVAAFVHRYARLMSRPCARAAVAALPPAVQRELLAHHLRATRF